MRKRVLWRYTPTLSQEIYIREQAKLEGRELSGMLSKLISEAILQRQSARHQTARLVSLLKGEAPEATQ
jgi:hypothetical protein